MIFVGEYPQEERLSIVSDYVAKHDIRHVVVISGNPLPLPVPNADQVAYSDVIMYVTFYRLLQEIDRNTLVVLDDVLRTQNRYDLAYNCIRNFLNQTEHQIIFAAFPLIDGKEDFMILFDFDTRSRWKRRPYDPDLVTEHAQVHIAPNNLKFQIVDVSTQDETRRRYAQERTRRLATLGAKDPHTLPRNLYLIGGRDKAAYIDAQGSGQPSLFGPPAHPRLYVARNRRLNHPQIVTYNEVTWGKTYTVVEFPHRFIEFEDFIRSTGQATIPVLAADLKVDRWYVQRYHEWRDRIHAIYADLQ